MTFDLLQASTVQILAHRESN